MNRWMTACLAATLLVACGNDDNAVDNAECGPDERCVDVEDMGEPNNVTPDMGSNNGMPDSGNNNPMPDTGNNGGTDMGNNGGTDMGKSCNRMPLAADRPRKVVTMLPFEDSMTTWEVLDLSQTGDLSRPGVTFSMRRAFDGVVQFTPDGEVGFVAQDDGTIGVFRFNSSGQPEVLNAALDPGFYVSGVQIGPAGDYLYGWDGSVRDVGGGLYRLPIACATGLPETPQEMYAPAGLIKGISFLDDNRAAIAATDFGPDDTENHVHLVDMEGPTLITSGKAYMSMDPITSGFTVTPDGKMAILGNSSFLGQTTVATARIDGDTLSPGQEFAVPDPVQIVASPFGNAALILSALDGDQLNVLAYDSGSGQVTLEGPLDVAEPVLLPGSADMVRRGALEGLVIIAENVALRRVQFNADGSVTDLGLFPLMDADGNQLPGAIGIQP